MSKVIMVSGHEADVAAALPLKVRDWKALSKLGVTPETLRDSDKLDIELSSAFVHHILSKANAAITMDMVDDLPLNRLFEIMVEIGGVQQGIDRPTSISSTSSPESTAGVQEIGTT